MNFSFLKFGVWEGFRDSVFCSFLGSVTFLWIGCIGLVEMLYGLPDTANAVSRIPLMGYEICSARPDTENRLLLQVPQKWFAVNHIPLLRARSDTAKLKKSVHASFQHT
jgi:hypothetical protein